MTKKYCRHSSAKKGEVAEAYFNGESMHALSQKHDVCCTLIPIWIDKYERGEFDDAAIQEELPPEYETRIAALERLIPMARISDSRGILKSPQLRDVKAGFRGGAGAP